MKTKPYHKQARAITDITLDAIKENLQELGDLSGITHDLNTGEIITGNQRSRIVKLDECKIVYTKKFDKPTKQGTVAFGFVEWEGQYLNYREVRWTAKQRERANITANALMANWDVPLLARHFKVPDMREYGIPGDILLKIEQQNKELKLEYGEPKYPIVPVFSERYDYVVIIAKNEIEIAWLDNFLQLQVEKSYKKQTVGVGRVITFEKFKKLVTNEPEKTD